MTPFSIEELRKATNDKKLLKGIKMAEKKLQKKKA
jgi:hypothetical protein